MLAEAALRRPKALAHGAVVVLALLAWAWIFTGAGMGMTPSVMITAFPVMENAMPGMGMLSPWTSARFMLTFAMWWVMMVAMMLPSAAPTILLYARAAANGPGRLRPATEAFLAGYLVVWGGFSLLATLLQLLLERIDLLASMEMASASRILSGTVLISAGFYQLSPIKQACLRHCRNPAAFISRHFRPGWLGALNMGIVHGTYCVGCCWMLMALLFVGGIMNLAWIALLTILVAAEKLLLFGSRLGKFAGLGCVAWGLAILAQS